MHFDTPKPRNDDERILPLINVVFLLLIFFMLAGALTSTDPFEVEAPRSDSESRPADHDMIIHIGSDGALALDGERVAREAMLAAIGTRLSETPEARVKVKADGALAAREAIAVMQDLRGVGVKRVDLLTVREGT